MTALPEFQFHSWHSPIRWLRAPCNALKRVREIIPIWVGRVEVRRVVARLGRIDDEPALPRSPGFPPRRLDPRPRGQQVCPSLGRIFCVRVYVPQIKPPVGGFL